MEVTAFTPLAVLDYPSTAQFAYRPHIHVPVPVPNPQARHLISELLIRISRAPELDYSIDRMARICHMSKYHFSRVFTRYTGYSPHGLLLLCRITYAQRLLVTTDLNITRITHEVGYTSIGTFSSRFHMEVGMSPSFYRANHNNEGTCTDNCEIEGGYYNGSTFSH